jgi:antitoxin VapB
MMGAIEGTIYKSGNSAAVRLPKEIGFEIGSRVLIERIGSKVELRLKHDPVEEKRRLAELVSQLEATWADAPEHPDRGRREPVEAPERAER